MLQIDHRLSFDFDCFSLKRISGNLLQKSRKIFGYSLTVHVQTSEFFSFETGKGIEISFVQHPYPSLQKPVKTSSISLFHLDDLAANKAYTIGRRGAWRDYVDIFFLLKRKIYNLEKIIQLAQKKFDGEFNEKLFLSQLVYFTDILILPTNFLKDSYTDVQIKSFLEKQVELYLRKTLGV